MTKIVHDDAIEWPNGEGYTLCTIEYATLVDKIEALKPDWVNMNDLSPADYQLYNELDHQRMGLQLAGHLGKSIRY